MVYQFSLPPLLLQALFTGDSTYLTAWAAALPALADDCTFFNFTASHDGIGVRPLEGLVPPQALANLAEGMKSLGAHINTKRNRDGTDSPYEINITYFDACGGTQAGRDDFQEDRFLCSQTVMMTLAGMPAFYIHSLLGTRNDHQGVARTGMARSINRRKWHLGELQTLLETDTHHARIFNELRRRIRIRRAHRCFHPGAPQRILDWGPAFFVVARGEGDALVSVSNLTDRAVSPPAEALPKLRGTQYDLLSGQAFRGGVADTPLGPYQTLWLIDDPSAAAGP
jgi:sucrose phosphorylase